MSELPVSSVKISSDDELALFLQSTTINPIDMKRYNLDFTTSDEQVAALEGLLNEHYNNTSFVELKGWRKTVAKFVPRFVSDKLKETVVENLSINTKTEKIIARYQAAMAALEKNIAPTEAYIIDLDEQIAMYTSQLVAIKEFLVEHQDSRHLDMAITRMKNLEATVAAITKVRNDVESQVRARHMSFDTLKSQLPMVDVVINGAILSSQGAAEVLSSQRLAEQTRNLCGRLFVESARATAEMRELSVQTVFSTVLDNDVLQQVAKIEADSRNKMQNALATLQNGQKAALTKLVDLSTAETLRLHGQTGKPDKK